MIALYCRVSTQEQAREGYSIGEQEERLKKYCSALGWNGVKSYIDAGFSGGNTDRPALQTMIKDVRAGKVERVVVYKLDRLSRSQKDTLVLIEDVFIKNGVDFVSISENFQTETPFGRAMVGILAVFAQLEREQIRERMSLGREGRIKSGKWGGGANVPVGYDYIDGELVVNEYEAMQIKEVHELYKYGESVHGIVRVFNDKGYSHKYGKWNTSRVRSVLSNDLYLGYLHYRGVSHKATHEPLIDEETFKANRDRFNNSGSYVRFGHCSLLAGVLWCKRCGARYTTRVSRYNDTHYYYYYCGNKCKNKIYKQDKLDNMIFNEMRGLVSEDVNSPEDVLGEDNREELETKTKTIQKELDSLDAKKSRLIDLYSSGAFSVEEIENKIKPLNEQRKRLEEELEKIADDIDRKHDYSDALLSISDVIDKGEHEEKRELIFYLLDRIEIDGDDLYITWKF